MNLRLENPSCDEASPDRGALLPDYEAESPVAPAGDPVVPARGEAPAPDEPGTAAPGLAGAEARKSSRVLLLEDDPVFNELIRDFLTGNGYTVVAVQNGIDGVREILAGEFAMILCDMNMPKLSGEMFFRAVERIRPELCVKFVFMSGDRGNSEMNDFIEKVGGFLLRKPFQLSDLLDWIAVTDACGAHEKVFALESGKPALRKVRPRADDSSASDRVQARRTVDGADQVVAPARDAVVPGRPLDSLHASEKETRSTGASVAFMVAGLALFLVLAFFWLQSLNAKDRVEAAAVERLALEKEWSAIAPRYENESAERAKIGVVRSQVAKISADRRKPRWTSVLRSLIPPGDGVLDILELDARSGKKDPGACEVRVRGIAGGLQPQHVVDRYRKSAEDAMKMSAAGRPVTVQFKEFKDVPGTLPDQKRVAFVMIVSMGTVEAPDANKKGGR